MGSGFHSLCTINMWIPNLRGPITSIRSDISTTKKTVMADMTSHWVHSLAGCSRHSEATRSLPLDPGNPQAILLKFHPTSFQEPEISCSCLKPAMRRSQPVWPRAFRVYGLRDILEGSTS